MKKLLTLAILLAAFAFPAAAGAHNGVDHSKGEQHEPETTTSPTASAPPTVTETQPTGNNNTLLYAVGAGAILSIGAGVFLLTRKKKS